MVHFVPPVAGEIRERVWHPSQRLVDDRDGGVYLHLDVAEPAELERWLLGFGAHARVIEPASLAARILGIHREAVAVASAKPAAPLRTRRRTPRVATAV